MTRWLVLFLIFTLPVQNGFGAELFDVNRSVRALGMGNAYTSVVSNSEALFYNPAGIAEAGYSFRFIEIQAGIGNLEALDTISNLQSAETFADTVRQLYGDYIWGMAHSKVAVTTPFLGVAAYGSLDTSVAINDPAVPELDVNLISDYGVATGFAFKIIPGFHLGTVIKRIVRTGNRKTYGASFVGTLNPDTISEDLTASGTGYSMDIGANFTVGGPASPTLSLVARNIGGTSFRPGNADDPEPPGDDQELVLGTSLVIDAPLLTIIPTMDIRYLDNSEINMGKKLHIGLELDLPLVDLRAGLHQGYYTLGAGLGLGLLDIQAATYGVELGEYPGQKEDRRYVIEMTVEIDFGGGLGSIFGLGGGSSSGSSGGSKGRRLKRRR